MDDTQLKKTALYAEHLKQGGLMVDFAGWAMPLHYGSQIEEHHFVRNESGMFDVSHMGIIEIQGPDSLPFLRYVLANNIDKLKSPGRAFYTCMLNEKGGIIDDLIVYYFSPDHCRLVVNAATTEKDLSWLLKQAASFQVQVNQLKNYAILAVQGPDALEKIKQALPLYQDNIEALGFFHFFQKDDMLIARTGYTGEQGVEIILSENKIKLLWETLLALGVHPIGLGARDTLRLEAGLNLYGQDMDEEQSPWVSNLMWSVALSPETRHFIGREALLQQKTQGIEYKLIGLQLLEKGVLRHDQTIYSGNECVGKITSGSFSPTLKRAIALARVKVTVHNGCLVRVRDKLLKAEMIDTPFVRSKTR